jgi:hypothetical protein
MLLYHIDINSGVAYRSPRDQVRDELINHLLRDIEPAAKAGKGAKVPLADMPEHSLSFEGTAKRSEFVIWDR